MRPYYEFNGDWFRYSVRRGEEKKFVKAWERVARIFRAELPGVKMMLGTAAAGHGKRISVAKAYPRGVDVLSIDYYNEWPFCRTKTCFAEKIKTGGGVNSLERLRRLAAKKGDPVMISEWANAGRRRHSRSGGGGESVAFMSAWHSWLDKHAGTGRGRVLGEIYFNIDGYDARFELRVKGRTTKGHAQDGGTLSAAVRPHVTTVSVSVGADDWRAPNCRHGQRRGRCGALRAVVTVGAAVGEHLVGFWQLLRGAVTGSRLRLPDRQRGPAPSTSASGPRRPSR